MISISEEWFEPVFVWIWRREDGRWFFFTSVYEHVYKAPPRASVYRHEILYLTEDEIEIAKKRNPYDSIWEWYKRVRRSTWPARFYEMLHDFQQRS
jgi:hypothetical protein